MSHTLRKINLGNTALAEITIVDYVAGGEQFTLAELGLTGSLTAIIILGVDVLSPQFIPLYAGGGKIQLQVRSGVELPSSTGVNLTFAAFIHGT